MKNANIYFEIPLSHRLSDADFAEYQVRLQQYTAMAPHRCLLLPVLVTAAFFVEAFVPPVAIHKGGSALRSRNGLSQPVTRPDAPFARRSLSCRPRPDTRRSALGPDGREIDIIRHREAYSYVEYWEDFYAG